MSNAVETFLMKLEMPEAIPKFKEMKVDRVITLRRLSELEISKAVPDSAQRQKLMEAINNRGKHDNRPHRGMTHAYPPRNAEDTGRGGMRGGYHGQGGGRGSGGGGRGMGRGHPDRVDNNPAHPSHQNQACRHHFSRSGCKYGDKCNFSHDQEVYDKEQVEGVPRRRPEDIGNTEDFSEVFDVPTNCMKYLIGKKVNRLKLINQECGTHNKLFSITDWTAKRFELTFYGPNPQCVQEAKGKVLSLVGAKREEEKKLRLQYTLNELEINQRAVKLLAACNIKNEGSPLQISEKSLKSIISSFRFEKHQDIRHFWVKTLNERVKLDSISKIVAQLQGVQAIMFSEPKRVVEMSQSSTKLSRHFNGVDPIFIYRVLPKTERLGLMEKFKEGEENKNGIRERLMVTSDDYAKLARKTVIPHVNLVINYTLPRSQEFYQLQSQVAGRNGTVGVSVVFVAPYEMDKFQDLQDSVHFELIDRECDIADTISQLVYDTVDNPLTSEDADPPKNWRDQLNEGRNAAA